MNTSWTIQTLLEITGQTWGHHCKPAPPSSSVHSLELKSTFCTGSPKGSCLLTLYHITKQHRPHTLCASAMGKWDVTYPPSLPDKAGRRQMVYLDWGHNRAWNMQWVCLQSGSVFPAPRQRPPRCLRLVPLADAHSVLVTVPASPGVLPDYD